MCLHFQPRRWCLYPFAHCVRRFRPSQLWARYRRRRCAPESESKAAQILALTFEIGNCWQILNHRMRLEESVELVAG